LSCLTNGKAGIKTILPFYTKHAGNHSRELELQTYN